MSKNPLAAKIAAPYARALYDFSVDQNLMHQITADFQNLEVFLNKTPDLTQYLNNPLINPEQKREVLEKTLQSEINKETFKFKRFYSSNADNLILKMSLFLILNSSSFSCCFFILLSKSSFSYLAYDSSNVSLP